jgi:hypothetical protein
MYTFKTAEDVLENTKKFHQYTASFFRTLKDEAEDERAQMLLGFMSDHEDKMGQSLKDYEQHASKSVLGTWIQYTLEESAKGFIDGLATHDNMSCDEISELGQQIDLFLVNVFEELMETAATEEVREVFQSIMNMEVEKKHSLTRAANSLSWDM